MSLNSNQPSLRKRTILVTGAAKRLGREIALHLAENGWQVAVHYRDSAAEAEKTVLDCAALSGISFGFKANLEEEGAVRNLVPAVVAKFGSLDAIVNSASAFINDSVESFGFESMEKHMRSNAGAPILLAQALHTHIKSRNSEHNPARGVIINMLDQKLWNQNPDFLSYTLSKVALEAANTLLAMELAPYLRVVGVAPGLTLTSHMLTDAKFEELHKLSPLGRSSTPQDVVATVKFALDNQSLTGTTLLVDGGQHLMKFERDFSLL